MPVWGLKCWFLLSGRWRCHRKSDCYPLGAQEVCSWITATLRGLIPMDLSGIFYTQCADINLHTSAYIWHRLRPVWTDGYESFLQPWKTRSMHPEVSPGITQYSKSLPILWACRCNRLKNDTTKVCGQTTSSAMLHLACRHVGKYLLQPI